jgi:transcriptional regulator with XRE-family HTH domain
MGMPSYTPLMLKKYMKKHNLNMSDVAREIDVSPTQIARILNGAEVSAKIGIKLAEAYNIPLWRLNPAIWKPPMKGNSLK